MLDQPVEGPHEVFVVNPRHELATVSRAPAETPTDEPQQRVENAPAVGAHHHRRSEGHPAGARKRRLAERALPGFHDFDAETPRLGRARLLPTDDAGRLVVGRVVSVRIEGGGAGLQPYAGRALRPSDGFTDDTGRVDARLDDGRAVRGAV